jgi:hypothetical protein
MRNLSTDRPGTENLDAGPDGGAARTSVRAERISVVMVGGQRLRVAVGWQSGACALLLFNGIGARLELLAPFVDALGGGAGTITFYIPGAGESPPPLLPYRLWMRLAHERCWPDLAFLGLVEPSRPIGGRPKAFLPRGSPRPADAPAPRTHGFD